MKTIAENMRSVLLKAQIQTVWYGEFHLIEQCAKLSNIDNIHPLIKIQRVLNALEKSPLFEKGYILADVNGKSRKYRTFTLKKQRNEDTKNEIIY